MPKELGYLSRVEKKLKTKLVKAGRNSYEGRNVFVTFRSSTAKHKNLDWIGVPYTAVAKANSYLAIQFSGKLYVIPGSYVRKLISNGELHKSSRGHFHLKFDTTPDRTYLLARKSLAYVLPSKFLTLSR